MATWSKDVHPDTGELYIDLGEDHEGYTRYVWFAGDMEVYDKADFEAADIMVAAPDLLGAAIEVWLRRGELFREQTDVDPYSPFGQALLELRNAINKALREG